MLGVWRLGHGESRTQGTEAEVKPTEDVLEAEVSQDERRAYEAAINSAFDLQRQAGRLEQKQRAEAHNPPRQIMRAFAAAQGDRKKRKVRKARARLARSMQRQYPDAWKKAQEAR